MNSVETKNNNIISLCIVTQNNKNYITKLLDSVYNLYKKDNIEIIVVDNYSMDGTKDEIKGFYDKLNLTYIYRDKIYSLPENRNYCVKTAKGNIIVMVDSDVLFIDENFFDNIRKFFSNIEISVLSPLIIFENNIIQSLGLTKIFNIPYIFKFNYAGLKSDDVKKLLKGKLLTIDMIHGACFIFRKDLFLKIGGFDEFMEPYNFDEMDFAIRAKMNGYKIYASSDICIMHFGGATTQRFKLNERAYLFISHGFRSILRNYSNSWIKEIFVLLIFLIASTFELLKESKNINSLSVTIKSLIWAIKNKDKPLYKTIDNF